MFAGILPVPLLFVGEVYPRCPAPSSCLRMRSIGTGTCRGLSGVCRGLHVHTIRMMAMSRNRSTAIGGWYLPNLPQLEGEMQRGTVEGIDLRYRYSSGPSAYRSYWQWRYR